MRAFFTALAFVVVALSAGAQTQTCAPLALVLAHPPAPVASHAILDAEQARNVMDWYNQQPPESDLTYSFVVLIRHVDNQISILFGDAGTVCVAERVPTELVPSLMEAIAGRGA